MSGSDAKLLLTVVICTYNRPELLRSCLESLAGQTADKLAFEVLVVDNNSTAATAEAAASFAEIFPHFRLVRETERGLSKARNRGWKEASGAYVAYIDDDARAYPDWVCSILGFMERRPEAAVFGGPYDGFTLASPPAWFPPQYGTYRLGDDERPIRVGEEWITGSNMVFRKELLREAGGFNADLGMKGDSVAYGEEINLLLALHEKGVPVWYSPSIRVSHLVREDKMRLGFLLSSGYLNGRNQGLTFGINRSFAGLLVACGAAVAKGSLRFFASGPAPLKRRLYYALFPLAVESGALAEYLHNRLSPRKSRR